MPDEPHDSFSSWLDPNAVAHPDSPGGGQGTGYTREPASLIVLNTPPAGIAQLDSPVRWTHASLIGYYRFESEQRRQLGVEIRKFENTCAKYSDQLRSVLPAGVIRSYYDPRVGGFKGLYGFVESLLSGVIDIATFSSKLLNPIYWFDPDLHRQIQSLAVYGFILGRSQYIIQYGTWDQKRELLAHIEELFIRAYTALTKSIEKEWETAVAEGKEAELVSKWTTRVVLEIGSFFIGVGELKAATTATRTATKVGETLKVTDTIGDAVKVERLATELAAGEHLVAGTDDVAKGAGSAAQELRQSGATSPLPDPPKAPDFVATPGGEVISVPTGATGPKPVISPSGKTTGFAYTGGKGGPGMDPRVTDVRIMDPTPPKGASPGYPNGYVTYQNAGGQAVNPATGKTVSNADPTRHIPLRPPKPEP